MTVCTNGAPPRGFSEAACSSPVAWRIFWHSAQAGNVFAALVEAAKTHDLVKRAICCMTSAENAGEAHNFGQIYV